MAFRFKQFTIEDSESTMPVGTDAMLLGAWADPGKAKRILDIGTGCGVLALMLAQRSGAEIDAVEIDPASAAQAEANFRNSPWSHRLKVIPGSVLGYREDERYDFIVSNPPYFAGSMRSPYPIRNRARHDEDLSLAELLEAVSRLLADHGSFAVVLPSGIMPGFVEQSAGNRFHPVRVLHVYPAREKSCNRILAQFSRDKHKIAEGSLCIKDEAGRFTRDYLSLTNDFHYFW